MAPGSAKKGTVLAFTCPRPKDSESPAQNVRVGEGPHLKELPYTTHGNEPPRMSPCSPNGGGHTQRKQPLWKNLVGISPCRRRSAFGLSVLLRKSAWKAVREGGISCVL